MSYRRLATFETLENRRALAVTATVSAGGDQHDFLAGSGFCLFGVGGRAMGFFYRGFQR